MGYKFIDAFSNKNILSEKNQFFSYFAQQLKRDIKRNDKKSKTSKKT
jgi:hypothetical protein